VRLEEDVKIKENILNKLVAQKARYAAMLQASSQFKSNQATTYKMLMAVNSAVPGGAWFTELSFESPTMLVIKGDAVNDEAIVKLVDRLQALPLVAQASLNAMTSAATPQAQNRKASGGYKRFEVRCVLKLDLSPMNAGSPVTQTPQAPRVN
jgi:type IV pilus assembly protein PilN